MLPEQTHLPTLLSLTSRDETLAVSTDPVTSAKSLKFIYLIFTMQTNPMYSTHYIRIVVLVELFNQWKIFICFFAYSFLKMEEVT